MDLLASLFVGKPQNILIVSVVLFLVHLALRFKAKQKIHHSYALTIASLSWALYAAWEWLILVKTPEANIRVDLLVIRPILTILLAWALWKTIKSYRA